MGFGGRIRFHGRRVRRGGRELGRARLVHGARGCERVAFHTSHNGGDETAVSVRVRWGVGRRGWNRRYRRRLHRRRGARIRCGRVRELREFRERAHGCDERGHMDGRTGTRVRKIFRLEEQFARRGSMRGEPHEPGRFLGRLAVSELDLPGTVRHAFLHRPGRPRGALPERGGLFAVYRHDEIFDEPQPRAERRHSSGGAAPARRLPVELYGLSGSALEEPRVLPMGREKDRRRLPGEMAGFHLRVLRGRRRVRAN